MYVYSFVIVRDIDSVLIYIQFTDYIRFVKFAWGRGPGCPCRDFITALFWLKPGAFLGVRGVTSQIGRVHDLIKIILISYCMIDNDNKLIVICFGLKS